MFWESVVALPPIGSIGIVLDVIVVVPGLLLDGMGLQVRIAEVQRVGWAHGGAGG